MSNATVVMSHSFLESEMFSPSLNDTRTVHPNVVPDSSPPSLKETRRQQQAWIIERAQSILEENRDSSHLTSDIQSSPTRIQESPPLQTPGKKSVLFATPLVQNEFRTPNHFKPSLEPMNTPMFEQFQLQQNIGFSPLFHDNETKRRNKRVHDFSSPRSFLDKRDLATPKERQNRHSKIGKGTAKRDGQIVHGTANRIMNTSFRLNEEQRSKVKIEISKQALRVHEISELKQQAAEYLHQGLFQQAIDTANLCHEKIVETFGDKHIDCIYIKILLGEAYTHCGGGLFRLASESFTDAQNIIEMSDIDSNLQLRLFAEILYTDIGYLMRLQSRFRESLEAYQKVFKIQQRQHGEFSLPVAQTLNNMALVQTSLGKFQEALQMFKEARQIRETLLGKGHLEVATVLNNTANVYLYIGKHKMALEFYNQGKSILEDNNQQQHPDYATCLVNIGSVFKELKQYEQALLMYQKAQTIREHVLGKDHNLTAATYLFIGHLLLCHDFDSYNKPIRMHHQWSQIPDETAYRRLSRTMKDTSQSISNHSMNNSFSNSRVVEELEEHRREQFKQAREYIESALKTRLRSLGLYHSETANCYNALGHVFLKEIQFDEAMKCYQTARKIAIRINGEDHPETIQCEENIVNLMLLIGQNGQDALQMLLKVAHYKRKFYGSSHPCTASMYNSIGNVLRQQGRTEQARKMYEKARIIYENAYGFDHQSNAIVYINIGNLYRHEGNFTEALKWYVKARSIRERLYGENHIETVYSIKNMALVHFEQEQYDLALDLLQRCKDALVKSHDFQQPMTFNSDANLPSGNNHIGRSSNDTLISVSSTSSGAPRSMTAHSLRYHQQTNSINNAEPFFEQHRAKSGHNLVELEVIHIGQLIAQILRNKHRSRNRKK